MGAKDTRPSKLADARGPRVILRSLNTFGRAPPPCTTPRTHASVVVHIISPVLGRVLVRGLTPEKLEKASSCGSGRG